MSTSINEMDWQKEDTSSWNSLLSCPNCGINLITDKQKNGQCKDCQYAWTLEKNILLWQQTHIKKSTLSVAKKIKNQLNPLSSWFLPFRWLTQYRLEKYYQRTLTNKPLALKWASHYLKDIHLTAGNKVLDHGCGRGRITAFANQLGFETYGQDVQSHPWWGKMVNSKFQVVSPKCHKLPWQDNTFSAVFCINVLHYFTEESLEKYVQEVHRVLKPGGYSIILEANSESYNANLPKKQIGQLFTLEQIRNYYQQAEFKELSLSYEGFYSPLFPLFINFVREQLFSKSFDRFDFNTWLQSIIPPKRRALWLLKVQKPA